MKLTRFSKRHDAADSNGAFGKIPSNVNPADGNSKRIHPGIRTIGMAFCQTTLR